MDKAIIKEKKIIDKGMDKLVSMDKKRDKACNVKMKKKVKTAAHKSKKKK